MSNKQTDNHLTLLTVRELLNETADDVSFCVDNYGAGNTACENRLVKAIRNVLSVLNGGERIHSAEQVRRPGCPSCGNKCCR